MATTSPTTSILPDSLEPHITQRALDCQLGSVMDSASCVFDTNGGGLYDRPVSDTDGDYVFDTSFLDTDFDGRAETFYTIKGSLYGDVIMRFDHDWARLYEDEEVGIHNTDPRRFHDSPTRAPVTILPMPARSA